MANDLVHAVLSPPELAQFQSITGVDVATLEVDVTGWSKLALLTDDCVYLFPRRGREAALLQGTRVCDVLHRHGVAVAPAVRGCWDDPQLSFSPFAAFERRAGRPWTSLETEASLGDGEQMLRSLGSSIATWHRHDPSVLPADLHVRAVFDVKPTLGRFLSPAHFEAAIHETARLAGAGKASVDAWTTALAPIAELSPVIVHGDVCENQLMVDANLRVDTVLDWDTAGVAHPLHDFDFGEWGFGIFRWEEDFLRLRHAMWDAYAADVGAPGLPSATQVHLAFSLAEFLNFERRHRDGVLDAWGTGRLERIRRALSEATEAVA